MALKVLNMATKILPISDLCRQATGIIKTLREQGDVVYITQHGRPSAVLIDYQAFDLFRDRSDKDWGLVDCVSFVVMTERGMTDALTTDPHFQQAGFRALLRAWDNT